ncbi:PREDICTED: tetraspanin-14-like, partial [Mesitornis unicolor]|uniref:tetraspanin-14-like n=1 Tax=Mesitornis unicolor TaxID=54374 RepID=UPI0005286E14
QKVVNTQCGYDVRKESKSQWDDQIFVKGCIFALEAWLPQNIYIVAGVFIAISLLQIFGIFLARTLISDIEAVKAASKEKQFKERFDHLLMLRFQWLPLEQFHRHYNGNKVFNEDVKYEIRLEKLD